MHVCARSGILIRILVGILFSIRVSILIRIVINILINILISSTSGLNSHHLPPLQVAA